jgi:hypothetical protein
MPLTVVNMVPQSLSGEASQDSEPNIAVNPANPLQIVATAFTADPLGGAFAPIYISSDGGLTWALRTVVPGNGSFGTGDITVGFATRGGHLYAGILNGVSGDMQILRAADYLATTPMEVLVTRGNEDQPWTVAGTVLVGAGADQDRVYVGSNDFNVAPRTAVVDLSLDAATAAAPAGFARHQVERVTPSGQDAPPIRIAAHPDGTVYAAFERWTGGAFPDRNVDIILTRDDNWGAGADPFAALADPGSTTAGRRVATNQFMRWNAIMGQERLGADLAIAVDPASSDDVVIAWCERVGGATGTDWTVHVRRSTDRGVNWTADLRTITNVKNPSLAINSRGRIGFVYQALTGTGSLARWETRFELTDDAWATAPTTLVLHTALASQPARDFFPYLGDYVRLLAVGKDFYGVFCGSNLPAAANFPNGITYHRNANWATNTLLAPDNVTPVPVSIDPFFFHWADSGPEQDFYVADWNDSPTSRDNGVEPSIHPAFWATSDVWNRQTDSPGGFNPQNQPNGENAKAGAGSLGDNYAFARAHRNAAGAAVDVSAHFLVSPFGTGSNFADAGTAPDAVIPFTATETEKVMANGYSWNLPPTSSTHLCLAVEIVTPNDPVAQPRLAGRAPGWPTDLLVVADNNKAQRNLGVINVFGRGQVCCYALVHNAASEARDLVLATAAARYAKGISLASLSFTDIGGPRPGRARQLKPGQKIQLRGMLPGENRFARLCLTIPAATGALADVTFSELVEGQIVNGFTFALRNDADDAIRDCLQLQVSACVRLQALFGIETLAKLERQTRQLSRRQKIERQAYLKLVRASGELIIDAVRATLHASRIQDPFGIEELSGAYATAAKARALAAVVPSHGNLLRALDAHLTLEQKAQGDAADVLQNVEWQRDVYVELRGLVPSEEVIARSDRFISGWDARTVGVADFTPLVRDLLRHYKRTVDAAQPRGVDLQAQYTELRATLAQDIAALQRAHRAFLVGLEPLRP